MAETCRDVLRALLVAASNMSDLDDQLDGYGFPADRIRAAIAADDAERLRADEDHVEALAWRMMQAWADRTIVNSRSIAEAAAARLIKDVMPGWLNTARIDLENGIDKYGLMRQLDAAQRIAGEMPESRRRHARVAVDGDLLTQEGLARADAYRERRFAALVERNKEGGDSDG